MCSGFQVIILMGFNEFKTNCSNSGNEIWGHNAGGDLLGYLGYHE